MQRQKNIQQIFEDIINKKHGKFEKFPSGFFEGCYI